MLSFLILNIISTLNFQFYLVFIGSIDKLKGNTIKLYCCFTNKATDVKSFSQFKNADYVPVQKQLLIDFSAIGIKHIDNIEGMTWVVIPNLIRNLPIHRF